MGGGECCFTLNLLLFLWRCHPRTAIHVTGFVVQSLPICVHRQPLGSLGAVRTGSLVERHVFPVTTFFGFLFLQSKDTIYSGFCVVFVEFDFKFF